MKEALIVLLLTLLRTIATVRGAYHKAPLVGLAHATSTIFDEYVVVFDEDVSKSDEWQHRARVVEMQSEQDKMDSFHIGNLRGYSARLSEKVMDRVRGMSEVAYVERNQVVSIATNEETECLVQMHAPWGLVRTASKNLPTSKKYPFKKNAGSDVKVYVLDTGIDKSHPEFEGRAIMGANFVPEQSSYAKAHIHGHGTHVAGIIASRRFGVAKQATVVDVRVLGSKGKGSILSVLAGLSWVAWSHKHKKGKAIVNLSLGSKKSFVLNAAVNQLTLMGIHIAASAGNNGKSACLNSPSSAYKSVTVAASNKLDRFFSVSNHGKCVDIIAPGVRILSLWPGKRYAIASGTSMAAPHVAGVMAKILSINGNLTPHEMKKKLKKEATRDKITRLPSGTPNLLLFNNNCN